MCYKSVINKSYKYILSNIQRVTQSVTIILFFFAIKFKIFVFLFKI